MPLTADDYIELHDGAWIAGTETNRATLDARMAALDVRRPLVLYFHGGLVNRASGMQSAAALLPAFTSARAQPFFVIWHSGLLDVLSGHLEDIAQEVFYRTLIRKLLAWLTGLAVETVGAKSLTASSPDDERAMSAIASDEADAALSDVATRLCASDGQVSPKLQREFTEWLGDDPQFQQAASTVIALAREGREDGDKGVIQLATGEKTCISADVLARIRGEDDSEEAKGLVGAVTLLKCALSVFTRTCKRLVTRRDHGLYSTVVEEILRELYVDAAGHDVWAAMKKDTRDAFDGDAAACGGTALLDALEAGAHAATLPPLILVGHSTGAVYILSFLERLRARERLAGVRVDVIFLAAACTMELFAAELKQTPPLIRRMASFGLSDPIESQDAVLNVPEAGAAGPTLGRIFPRSLLYFVAGVVEDETDMPLVGMQRYYRADHPYGGSAATLTKAFFSKPVVAPCERRQVWAIAGPPLKSGARHHGDLHTDPDTVASVMSLIAAWHP